MRKETGSRTIHRRVVRVIGAWLAGSVLGAMLLVGGVKAAGPASAQAAQEIWFDRAKVVAQLAARYDEAPIALGLTSDGAVLELFTAPDGSSWTIVVTLPNGLSRVIATGESWITRPRLVKGRRS